MSRLLIEPTEGGRVRVEGREPSTTMPIDDLRVDFTGSGTVRLIPETLARTTLGFKQPGDVVNLEVDVIAKYVEKMVRPA